MLLLLTARKIPVRTKVAHNIHFRFALTAYHAIQVWAKPIAETAPVLIGRGTDYNKFTGTDPVIGEQVFTFVAPEVDVVMVMVMVVGWCVVGVVVVLVVMVVVVGVTIR